MSVSAPPPTSAPGRASRGFGPDGGGAGGRLIDRLCALLPVLFAVPLLAGLAVTLSGIASLDAPDPQVGALVNADAAALALGQPLYQDPAEGYTGALYTPLFPIVVSLLLRLETWTGWPIVLAVLGTLALVALTARLAYRAPGPRRIDRLLGLLGALGIGAMGWGLVAAIQFNGMLGGPGIHDQVAWVPAVFGLVLLPAAAGGSRRALAGSVLLLTAAFWTKQNAVVAELAAVAWIAGAAALRAVPWRRALGFVLALGGVNALILGTANLATSGWEYRFNFAVPSGHPFGDLGDQPFPLNYGKFLREDLVPATLLAALVAGALWLVVVAGRRRPRAAGQRSSLRERLTRLRPELRRPLTLAVPLLLTLGAALVLRASKSLNLYFLVAPSGKLEAFVIGVVMPALVLPAVFVTALALVVAARGPRSAAGRRRLGRWLARARPEDRLATVLLVSIAVGLPFDFYFRQKLGADDHYYIGLAWALVLLAAIAYRKAGARRGTALTAAGVVAAVFAAMVVVSPTSELGRRQNAINLPSFTRVADADGRGEHEQWLTVFFPTHGLYPAEPWSEISGDLRAYARDHRIYSGSLGELNAEPQGLVWPIYANFYGNLAAGIQPTYLVDALLERRFDAVTDAFGANERDEFFASGAGEWEENYFWKLDRVLATKYEPSDRVPSGLLARRPGPDPAPWMQTCFGPFDLAGAAFRINHGGGFWCRPPGSSALELRDTPAAWSDVRTADAVRRVEGQITVTLPRRAGAFEVAFEPPGAAPVRIAGRRAGGRVTLATPGPEGRSVRTRLRSDRAVLRLDAPARAGGPQVEVPLPAFPDGAVVRLRAERGSRARFDLRALRLG